METATQRKVSIMPAQSDHGSVYRRRSSTMVQTATDHGSVDRRRSSTMVQTATDAIKRRQSMAPPGFGVNARRKQSMWMTSISETSGVTASNQSKPVLENTYRLEPTEKERFRSNEVAKIIRAVLERFLRDVTYDANTCAALCKEISQQLTNEVKELGYIRHKIVCHVILNERKDQAVQMVSRCLWNPTTDSYASVEYKNAHLCAIGMVHGIYLE